MTVRERLDARLTSVDDALSHIQSGARIFLGSGCAEPQLLVRGLCRQADRLRDVEVCSLLTLGTADYVNERFLGHFRHNAYFIGGNVRGAVREGRADYTPIFLSEIGELFHSGQQPVDVALLQLSPPDRHGQCSMGIHVDIQRAALDAATLVVAEINPNMPRTFGTTNVPLERVDYCVETQTPILELPYSAEPDEISLEIGLHVANLVEDGACLQLGIGAIPNAVARFLDERRHLGLHTEMFSDGILGLLESGNVDNSNKVVFPEKSVASFAMGTRRLYDYIDENPTVEFHSSDFVNDPRIIARNDQVVAINSALQVDLTGQVCADSLGYDFYSGIGGQVDFVRGAAMSRGGKPIIALTSTAKEGTVSRIVPILDEGAGVVTSRGDVHYIATEYGVAYLHGKSIRERALALIEIAHPDFRAELQSFVREKHYAYVEPKVLREVFDAYPEDWVKEREFGGQTFTVRPLKPDDMGLLRDFFYTHTLETIYHRYFTVKRELTADEALHLCSMDFKRRMAFGVFDTKAAEPRIVAIGRYELNPRTNLAETAIVVGEDFRRIGLGSALLRLLCEYAQGQGIEGIVATILAGNQGMVRIHRTLGHQIRWNSEDRRYDIRHRFANQRASDRDATKTPPPKVEAS